MVLGLPNTSNPAIAFLQHTDVTALEELFRLYAQYLLHSSDALELPVPLSRIRVKHNFKRHLASSVASRGFLVGNNIFVKEEDGRVAQRFTEAHEMMETLFVALKAETPTRFSPTVRQNFLDNKEGLCDQGAAELLMPSELFFPLVKNKGLGLAVASELANLCGTSLTATVRRMFDANVTPCIFAYLVEGYKQSEQKLIEVGKGKHLQPELRVQRYWKSPRTKTILIKNESFSRNSSIYQTLRANTPGEIKYGQDDLDLEKIKGRHNTESVLVTINDTPVVMALIHLSEV